MSIQLSDRETQYVAAAMQSLKGKPEIDYENFAKLTGLKGAKSARDCFAPTLKRLMAANSTGKASDAPPTPTKSNKGRKRKVDNNDDGASPEKNVAKRARGQKANEEVKEEVIEKTTPGIEDEESEDDSSGPGW